MVHTAIRRSHTDVRNPDLIGSHGHSAFALRRVTRDRRNEITPWRPSESDFNRVNGLRWQELLHDIGYIWPQHLNRDRERVRYSAAHALATSAGSAVRGRRWEEPYVERCLAESGKSAMTLDKARRSQVIRSLLDCMATAPLD